jgi:hypothetical protein
MVSVAATLTATPFAHRLLGFLAALRPSLMASIGFDSMLAKQGNFLCGIGQWFHWFPIVLGFL